MIAMLRDWTDRFLGRGEAATTVPPFDGALKPNRMLEDAATLLQLDAPDDLATDGNAVFASDGTRVLRIEGRAASEVARFDRPITALACVPGGGLAVALDGKEVRTSGGAQDGQSWKDVAGGLVSVNAIAPAADGGLLVTEGSRTQPYERWCHDLMELGKSGRVLQLDRQGGGREIARNLAFAYGVCQASDGIWVSETWRHRVDRFAGSGGGLGAGKAVIDRLPAYPSRITPASGGEFWLTAFTARTQLVEFILREPAYRKRMMAEIDPRYWVAPALTSGNTFLEPMQGAHIKTMGILKPWAPPRSYGLVVRLSAAGLPRYSLHSRVDGKNHGVTAAVECQGQLYVLAKGPKRLLRLSIADAERSLSA
jgi:hypothetical protein